jgi:ketosteroid isomerase-like protein
MIQETVSGVLLAQREWLAAVRAKDIDALMRRVTDHIAVIHPNGKAVRGADDFARTLSDFSGSSTWSNLLQLKGNDWRIARVMSVMVP